MGLSVAELQARAKETLAKQRSEAASQASISRLPASSISSSSTSSIKTKPALGGNIRVDSSPVKVGASTSPRVAFRSHLHLQFSCFPLSSTFLASSRPPTHLHKYHHSGRLIMHLVLAVRGKGIFVLLSRSSFIRR
jgi:hypothetical protein